VPKPFDHVVPRRPIVLVHARDGLALEAMIARLASGRIDVEHLVLMGRGPTAFSWAKL
jgi:hypothetical protein